MKPVYLMALDQGSTSSKAIVLNGKGKIIAYAQAKLSTFHPRPGWVEHDPQQLLLSQKSAIRTVFHQLGRDKNRIVAMGIANQRSTLLLWERETGKTVIPAISWQDRRALDFCKSLEQTGGPARSSPAEFIRRKTGLRLSPYYAGPKLGWVLKKQPQLLKRAERGELLCGTVNTYLIWHFSKGKAHFTDHTNAARMLLMDLAALEWDKSLLDLFGIPIQILPRIVPTCSFQGEAELDHKTRIPIYCSLGDQQSASLGMGCIQKGDVTLNYGTGGFLLVNTGNRPQHHPGLLTSIAWSSPGKIRYLVEGPVNSVGSALDWLRLKLGLFRDFRQLAALYRRSQNPILVLPSLNGLGAPYWEENQAAVFSNIQHNTEPEDFIRGTVEGIAFLIKEVWEAASPGINPEGRIRAAGGLAQLDGLIQLQSDLFQKPIERPKLTEATVLGAAFLAGLGYGIWSDPVQIRDLIKAKTVFKPRLLSKEAAQKHLQWKQLLQLALQNSPH